MPTPDSPVETNEYDDLSFEDAMEELELLVRSADSDRLPLDEMISGYEKGTRLYQICRKRLEEARGRIELIRKLADETADLEAFGESGSAANEKKAVDSSKNSPRPAPVEDSEEGEDDDDEILTFKDGELF